MRWQAWALEYKINYTPKHFGTCVDAYLHTNKPINTYSDVTCILLRTDLIMTYFTMWPVYSNSQQLNEVIYFLVPAKHVLVSVRKIEMENGFFLYDSERYFLTKLLKLIVCCRSVTKTETAWILQVTHMWNWF